MRNTHGKEKIDNRPPKSNLYYIYTDTYICLCIYVYMCMYIYTFCLFVHTVLKRRNRNGQKACERL